MDDQYAELRRFHGALTGFNQQLRRSVQDLKSRHDAVAPYWKDEFRRTYDSEWGTFDREMTDYLKRSAGRYERFLDDKIKALGRYLNG